LENKTTDSEWKTGPSGLLKIYIEGRYEGGTHQPGGRSHYISITGFLLYRRATPGPPGELPSRCSFREGKGIMGRRGQQNLWLCQYVSKSMRIIPAFGRLGLAHGRP
jgi:hypothetical protein